MVRKNFFILRCFCSSLDFQIIAVDCNILANLRISTSEHLKKLREMTENFMSILIASLAWQYPLPTTCYARESPPVRSKQWVKGLATKAIKEDHLSIFLC